MFPYRGLVVLIALCAYGAIQASFLERHEIHRFKHRLHHGNFNSSNSSGNWNVTLPSGNYSQPGFFNSSGGWNLTRPVRSHRFNSTVNSTYVPSWKYPVRGHGLRLRPGNSSSSGNYSSSFPQRQWSGSGNFSTSFNNTRLVRGVFDRRPSYGTYNSSRVPAGGRPPVYQPAYRPAVNSTWTRPSNNSWPYSG